MGERCAWRMEVHTSSLASSAESCFCGAEALLCSPSFTSLSSSWPTLSILAAAASAICTLATSSDLAALCALRPALTPFCLTDVAPP